MKYKILLLFTAFISLVAVRQALADGGTVVYERWIGTDNYVMMSDRDGRNERKLFIGYDAEISPDGSKIAYTWVSDDAPNERYIAVYDIAAKKNNILKHIPGTNNYAPRWSPNGKKILFNQYYQEKKWLPGIYDTEKKSTKTVAAKLTPPDKKKQLYSDVYSPFWSHNGEYIYGNDLKYIYKFSAADGKQVDAIPMSAIFSKHAMIDSSIRFSSSADGNSWLFSVEQSNEKCGRCEASVALEPLKGITYEYKLKEKKTVRISPADFCTGYAAYGTKGDIYISAHKTSEKPRQSANYYDLYLISAADKKITPIAQKAYEASVSK